MLIERLILEFQTTKTSADPSPEASPARLSKFNTLQEFVEAVSAHDGPCAVVRVDMQELTTDPADITSMRLQFGSGATETAANLPVRPHLLRSGSARLQRVNDELQSQARHDTARETVQHLDETLEILSPREWDVLMLMLRARTCKEMSSELHIGLPTVAKHRARVLKRFGVRDHVELFQLLNNLMTRGRMPTTPREMELASGDAGAAESTQSSPRQRPARST